MKKPLIYILFFDLIFVFFLSVSGSLGGILGKTFYYIAFLLPIALALLTLKSKAVVAYPIKLNISRKDLELTLPCIAPLLALVFLISWLTTLILSHFGEGSTTDVSGNLARVIFTHALVTAALEEVLFRYIPLAYLAPYSKRMTVLISALLFAFVHGNIYQIPYAFVAGAVFAVIDIAFDSVAPSFVIHFANNTASIFWLRYGGEGRFATVYVIVLVSAALLSLVPIFLAREKYKAKIVGAFYKNER